MAGGYFVVWAQLHDMFQRCYFVEVWAQLHDMFQRLVVFQLHDMFQKLVIL